MEQSKSNQNVIDNQYKAMLKVILKEKKQTKLLTKDYINNYLKFQKSKEETTINEFKLSINNLSNGLNHLKQINNSQSSNKLITMKDCYFQNIQNKSQNYKTLPKNRNQYFKLPYSGNAQSQQFFVKLKQKKNKFNEPIEHKTFCQNNENKTIYISLPSFYKNTIDGDKKNF